MRTLFRQKALLLLGLLLFPGLLAAQSIPLMGDGEEARECYRNASIIVRVTGATPSREMILPCHHALKATRQSPHDRAATFANRGILLAGRGELSKALADYDQALEILPARREIYVNRAFLFYFEGQFEEALRDFSHAVGLEGGRKYVAFLGRGLVHEELGMLDLAAADYRRALDFWPNWPRAQQRLEDIKERRERP